jgi:hypothetical protein
MLAILRGNCYICRENRGQLSWFRDTRQNCSAIGIFAKCCDWVNLNSDVFSTQPDHRNYQLSCFTLASLSTMLIVDG